MQGGNYGQGNFRRVVVVRPPDPSVFEEAIFVVRENRNAPRDVLREACAVAETISAAPSVRRYSRKRWTNAQLMLSALGGGSAVGLLWALTSICGLF